MSKETLRVGIQQTGKEGRRESLLGSSFGGNVGSESGELKALCPLMVCFLGISETFFLRDTIELAEQKQHSQIKMMGNVATASMFSF